MRIDKFLNSVNITKRRTIAQDMLKNKVVFLNSILAKPSKVVKVGDVIEIRLLDRTETYKVLEIPRFKTTPKSEQTKYVKKG